MSGYQQEDGSRGSRSPYSLSAQGNISISFLSDCFPHVPHYSAFLLIAFISSAFPWRLDAFPRFTLILTAGALPARLPRFIQPTARWQLRAPAVRGFRVLFSFPPAGTLPARFPRFIQPPPAALCPRCRPLSPAIPRFPRFISPRVIDSFHYYND